MLDSVRFVQGAIAKKDYVPALKHFRIADNRITSYNGVIALSALLDLDITATPRADQFTRAIAACDGDIALTVTGNGRIGIRSGRFRAFVECTDEVFPNIEPQGELVTCHVPLVAALKRAWPFISDDASRPWSLGVLFSQQSVLATNNVIAVEIWLGNRLPFPQDTAIPKEAVAEMLRVGSEPIAYRLTDNSLTLHYDDGRWLQTRLLSTAWPPVRDVIAEAHADTAASPLGPVWDDLRVAVEGIGPFVGDDHRVHYGGTCLSTSLDEEQGARFEIGQVEGQGIFNYAMLKKVIEHATYIDLSHRNGPKCPFGAPGLRGVVMGYR